MRDAAGPGAGRGAPVIHIQHDAGPGSPFDVNGESGAIASRWRRWRARGGW
jgi:hypothetical protein